MDCNLCGVILFLVPIGLQRVKGVVAGMNLWTVLLGRRLAPRSVCNGIQNCYGTPGPCSIFPGRSCSPIEQGFLDCARIAIGL